MKKILYTFALLIATLFVVETVRKYLRSRVPFLDSKIK